MKTSIYLDNAATTKTAQEVVDAMLPYFTENYGNPSSIYDLGTKSKEAITKGREQIAEVLGAKSEEIYFTAGGSEADNWALKATFEAYKNKGNHIITTKIEHHAILHTCEYLEKRGAKILNGLGMLIYQGIIAYELFTDTKLPDDMGERIKKEVFGR